MYETQDFFNHRYDESLKTEILEFCKAAFEHKEDPSHVNMWSDDWENSPETFPYLVYKSDRFTDNNGEIFILRENGKIIAISGIAVSDFDPNVAIGGVRTWVIEEHRGKFLVGRHLMPLQLKWAKEKGLKTIVISFNEYNKNLIKYFRRSGLGIVKKRNPNSLFFNGMFEAPFPVLINFTKQWAVYHKIDESYVPDWEAIRYV
jgi:hypothetical protein